MNASGHDATLRIGLAQIAPVFLNRAATLAEVIRRVEEAATEGLRNRRVFPKSWCPVTRCGSNRTDGARFEHPDQSVCTPAISERRSSRSGAISTNSARWPRAPQNHRDLGHRGGPRPTAAATRSTAVACSSTTKDVSRQSTESSCPRTKSGSCGAPAMGMAWSRIEWGGFNVGALNCWENWMPLTRAALLAQGMNLHFATWPGSPSQHRKQHSLFRVSKAAATWASVAGVLRAEDIPDDVPLRDRIIGNDATLLNGGSAVAGPDGRWVIAPVADKIGLITADVDPVRVREARQSFDPAGHYARPDVLRLTVDRRRQSAARFIDED